MSPLHTLLRKSLGSSWQAWVAGLLVLAFSLPGQGQELAGKAQPELLVRAKNKDGKDTTLFEKVVVISSLATIEKTPGADKKPIEPYSIFFRMKTDDGQLEKNGLVRVGDSAGRHMGWLPKKDVTEWNTRFVLEPVNDPNRRFKVIGEQKTTATVDKIPEGKRGFALVTRPPGAEKGDDTEYPVLVYIGRVQSQEGTFAKERNDVKDLKLEVVFAMETLIGMKIKAGDTTALASCKQMIRDTINELSRHPDLKGKDAVRYGIVEYKDDVENVPYKSKLLCKLTGNLDEVEAVLDSLKEENFQDGGDWPEDVLAGLVTAINDAGWSENSSKHILLIGASSFQLYGKGEGPNQFGYLPGQEPNKFMKKREATNRKQGYNSTGLSIEQLINRARPQAGSAAERVRNAKTFHAILAGRATEELPGDLKFLKPDFLTKSDEEVNKFIEMLQGRGLQVEQIRKILPILNGMFLNDFDRKVAVKHHQQLVRNNGDFQGLCEIMEPKSEDIKRTSAKVRETLLDSFVTLAKVRAGKMSADQLRDKNTSITQTFYTIVGASEAKFKDQEVFSGLATVRDDGGREVAHKKVLVARKELERLRSTFDALHTKFKEKTKKIDRQDVSGILTELKQITALTSTGQETFDANTKLKDIISDLPLRTPVLDTSAADIAVMTSDAFTQWLGRLETARTRLTDLLDSKTDWLFLSSLAPYEKFTFLRLSELP